MRILINPNPCNQFVKISSENESIVLNKVFLIDIFGTSIAEKISLNIPSAKVIFDVSKLKPGIYFIKAEYIDSTNKLISKTKKILVY